MKRERERKKETDTTYPHDLLTDETQQFSNSPQKQTPQHNMQKQDMPFTDNLPTY